MAIVVFSVRTAPSTALRSNWGNRVVLRSWSTRNQHKQFSPFGRRTGPTAGRCRGR